MAHQDPVRARRHRRGEQTPVLGQDPLEPRPCVVVGQQAVRYVHPLRSEGDLGFVARPVHRAGALRCRIRLSIDMILSLTIERGWLWEYLDPWDLSAVS